jgi:hypothetical protein
MGASSPAEDPPLPDGWTKHWSNTWKKHYWFDSKTGKQSWEAPTAANSAPHPPPEVGAKRAAPDAWDDGRNKMAKTEAEAPPPASKQQPAASIAVSAPSPAAKKPVRSGAGAGRFSHAYWMRLLDQPGASSTTQHKTTHSDPRQGQQHPHILSTTITGGFCLGHKEAQQQCRRAAWLYFGEHREGGSHGEFHSNAMFTASGPRKSGKHLPMRAWHAFMKCTCRTRKPSVGT